MATKTKAVLLEENERLREALEDIVTIYNVDRRSAHIVSLRMASRAGEALAHDAASTSGAGLDEDDLYH